MFRICTIVLILIGIFPQVSFARERPVVSIKETIMRNPEKDARDAIRAGRKNFLGIAGFNVKVPGVSPEGCLVSPEFVDIIPGTSDVIDGKNQGISIDDLTKYAFRYNSYIQKHSNRKIKMDCKGAPAE